MSELRDTAIKLFGRNIPVTDSVPDATQPPNMDESTQAANTDVSDTPSEKLCIDLPPNSDEGRGNNVSNSTLEIDAERTHNSAVDHGAPDNLSDQEKVLKKPDKILPCPRCNSLDTKFCYFNNYNVNQPRHFCKNCHRYWTAGGTMRNVPVGAGRRKNKHSPSQYRQVVVSPVAESDTLSSANHQHLSCVGLPAASRPTQETGEDLKFGRDAPLSESMAASLNAPLGESMAASLNAPLGESMAASLNAPLGESMAASLNLKDLTLSVKVGSATVGNSGEEPSSSGFSSASTTVHENVLPEIQRDQVNYPGQHESFTSEQPMQCYPGPTWAYPWNPCWNAMMFAPNNNNQNIGNTDSPPVMAVSSFCPSSITVPLVPASYWGCLPSWDGRNWNIPLVATSGCLSPSSSASNNCLGNNSPTLGKHSRDASLHAEEKSEQSLWIPKTLRIDDPDEAAKSSIWDTLGIKPSNIQPIKKGGIFKAFQSKPETVSRLSDADADQVLQSNPAAFSRSQSFQENT